MPSLGRYALEVPSPPADTLPAFFHHLAEHATLYRRLLGANGSARLVAALRQRLTTATYASRNLTPATENEQTHASDPPTSPHDVPSAFLAGASLGVAIDWLERGCPGDPEELARQVWTLLIAAGGAAG